MNKAVKIAIVVAIASYFSYSPAVKKILTRLFLFFAKIFLYKFRLISLKMRQNHGLHTP